MNGTVVAPSPMRERIARRMTESKQQVPHIYLTVDVRQFGCEQQQHM